MNTLKKRYKMMAALGAAVCSVTAVVPTGVSEPASAASLYNVVGSMTVSGSVNMIRNIVRPKRSQDLQAVIDACVGAVQWNGGAPGDLYLGAHRTSCRNGYGFGGVERLKQGDTVTVTLDGKTTKYEWFANDIGRYGKGQVSPPAPIGTQLTLQTSKSSKEFYLKHFTPVGIPGPVRPGHKITQGRPACVRVPGARKNDWVFVNVTPVRAESGGYATVYPRGNRSIVPDPNREPSTSSVNWVSGAPAPNATLVQAGDNSEVCAATYGGPVDIIFDALAIASPDKFNAAQRRLIDTRLTGQLANNSSVCFSVPGAANKWTVLNLVSIGKTGGWGRLQRPNNGSEYSNTNFGIGDVDANMVVIKVPSDGRLCYTSGGASHAVVDLIATAKAGTFIDTPWLPRRSKDVRNPPPASVLVDHLSGSGGVANGWAIINATPIPHGGGVARFYDCQLHPATGSDVNYGPRVDPNVGVIKTGPYSEVCMASTGPRPGWVFDVLAVAHPGVFTTPSKRRIYDSRP